MFSDLSTLNIMTEVTLSKAPNPQLLPRHKWLPTALGVCSLLCVHLDGLIAERKFRVWVTICGGWSIGGTAPIKLAREEADFNIS